MISPSYPTNSRQRKGDPRCESLHLVAMHVNFHFISHLELVKHYHSITVNLKTMKSFGFSQNPPLLSIAAFYILKSKQNFNRTDPKAIYRTCWWICLWNFVFEHPNLWKNFPKLCSDFMDLEQKFVSITIATSTKSEKHKFFERLVYQKGWNTTQRVEMITSKQNKTSKSSPLRNRIRLKAEMKVKFRPRMPAEFRPVFTSKTSPNQHMASRGQLRQFRKKQQFTLKHWPLAPENMANWINFHAPPEYVIKAAFYTKICLLWIVLGSNRHSVRKDGRKLRAGEQNEQHFLLSLFSG